MTGVTIALLGPEKSGKSELVKRISTSGGDFSNAYVPTVAVEYAKKNDIKFWDLAGADRFNNITESYLRQSNCWILTYDMSDLNSFKTIENYIQDYNFYGTLDRNRSELPVIILMGTKRDKNNNGKMDPNNRKKIEKQLSEKILLCNNITNDKLKFLYYTSSASNNLIFDDKDNEISSDKFLTQIRKEVLSLNSIKKDKISDDKDDLNKQQTSFNNNRYNYSRKYFFVSLTIIAVISSIAGVSVFGVELHRSSNQFFYHNHSLNFDRHNLGQFVGILIAVIGLIASISFAVMACKSKNQNNIEHEHARNNNNL